LALDRKDTIASTQVNSETPHEVSRSKTTSAVTIVAHDVGSVGGMERQLEELVLGLRRLGHEVTVIARSCELPESAGVVFHRVRAPARPFLLAYPWFMLAGSLAVRRWRRGAVQATGAIVLNRVDVISVHYCHQIGPTNASRSTRLFRAHVYVIGLLKRIAERFCLRVNSRATIVCVSEGVAEDVREYFPRLADRVLVIHNGVDTDAFAPGIRRDEARELRDSLNIGEDRLIAVFVGSEWERKGLEPAIRALALSPEWTLVVAGAGERARYQELADALNVGGAVRWLGVTPDVQLVYQLADAFLMPSKYEAFSIATLEAAASGLPMLVTPVNGARELIEDGHNGFLVTREPDQVAERLKQLGADPALRMRLGAAARQSALEFGRERMVDSHQELFLRLADES
jgi:glycosyltransferase involved in cell wall biosynthesis